MAERALPRKWLILFPEQGARVADGPPLERYRAFIGETGEDRAGPVVPGFEALYATLVAAIAKLKQAEISHSIDKVGHDDALALFVCAPQALYAVNKHLDFRPYATTFELAQTKIKNEHWSRR